MGEGGDLTFVSRACGASRMLTMLILMARAPKPDAAYRPGRRWFAAADAVFWPLLWIALIRQLPVQTGVVGPVGTAVVCIAEWGALTGRYGSMNAMGSRPGGGREWLQNCF